jgi:UDP-N-acetylmuramoyl-tripeptide--D-alanyl-D-alanine ligase
VIEWDAARIAAAAGARVVGGGERVAGSGGEQAAGGGPRRVVIDSRKVHPGDLMVGLAGEHVDGGAYAEQALRAGAWGVLVTPEHARTLAEGTPAVADRATAPTEAGGHAPSAPADSGMRAERVSPESVPVAASGAVLAHPNPLAGMQSLARAWRRALGEEGAQVVGITGSTGKTSTKDILAALLRAAHDQLGGPAVASEANLNTEIGLPLALLAAPAGTKALVLEMAMRGAGQIAELTAIARPDVGVIVNVGPVHLEQLGTLDAVAAAKAELIAGMASGATVVVPAGEPLLRPHLRTDLRTVTFGEGGDVEMVGRAADGAVTIIDRARAAESAGGGDHVSGGGSARGGERLVLRPSFAQSHNLRNLLAAVAAARALGVTPRGRLDVEFSALRGERIALANGIVLINDCYNANPMSMRAALDELAASEGRRKVAVLGDMLELGGQERRLHREVGAYARARGVDLLLAVGPLAREMGEEWDRSVYSVADADHAAELLGRLLRKRDIVLVKGSRGVGLERVARTLLGRAETGGRSPGQSRSESDALEACAPAPGQGEGD